MMKTPSLLRRYVRPLTTLGFVFALGGICAALSAESPQPRSVRSPAAANAASAPRSAQNVRSPKGNSTAAARSAPPRSPSKPIYKERSSDNPVRFVFAPKQGEQNLSSPDADPSAAAIWSTLLTGNISPEIVRWHIRQRQQGGMNPVQARSAKRSEYEKMLRRTEFSLAPKSNVPALDRNGQPLPADPSGGAILARFLTGRNNAEISVWKNEQALYLAARTGNDTQNLSPDFRQYPRANTPNAPAFGRLTAAVEPPLPRPLSDAVPADYVETTPTAALARTERPMVDDHFPVPEARAADTGIRPASAEIVSESGAAKRSDRMKVYRPRGTFDETPAADSVSIRKVRPLPQNIPEEWSPEP